MPDAAVDDTIVLEVFGEGKTDIGTESHQPREPIEGVVPILVHRLCDKPARLRVKSKRFAFLQGKRLWQKVWFAKRQASYNRGTSGVVFVLDTEGDDKILGELAKGRDNGIPEFPMAIGVAQPCIEAWLLSDGSALRLALQLPRTPEVSEQPESLPADQRDRQHPKRLLAEIGAKSQVQKDGAAARIDLELSRTRCPLSFEPFAAEVGARIKPLFA
jgi:hypothetical protein